MSDGGVRVAFKRLRPASLAQVEPGAINFHIRISSNFNFLDSSFFSLFPASRRLDEGMNPKRKAVKIADFEKKQSKGAVKSLGWMIAKCHFFKRG